MSKRRRVAAPSDSVLEINVGGTIFVTKKSTLSFENDSMLARLFDDESPFGELPRDQSDRGIRAIASSWIATPLFLGWCSSTCAAPGASSVRRRVPPTSYRG